MSYVCWKEATLPSLPYQQLLYPLANYTDALCHEYIVGQLTIIIFVCIVIIPKQIYYWFILFQLIFRWWRRWRQKEKEEKKERGKRGKGFERQERTWEKDFSSHEGSFTKVEGRRRKTENRRRGENKEARRSRNTKRRTSKLNLVKMQSIFVESFMCSYEWP